MKTKHRNRGWRRTDIDDYHNMPLREKTSPIATAHRLAGKAHRHAEEETRAYWKKFKRTAKHKTLRYQRGGE